MMKILVYCISCLDMTKYRYRRCKFPLCNKCSLTEENEEIPGWKAGKFVAYCASCRLGSQYSTHSVGGEDAFAVFGLKAPFSLFRSRKNVLMLSLCMLIIHA